MTYRYYSSTAAATTLTTPITSSTTTIPVAATTGFPVSVPYVLLVDGGSSSEELILVTAQSGLSLTVTRGFDSTSPLSHSLGAPVIHAVCAQDERDSRDHEAASTGVHGLGVGSSFVGTVDTQALTNKTLVSPVLSGTLTGGTISGSTLSGVTLSGATGSLTAPAISDPAITAGGSWTGGPTIDAATLTGQPTISDLTHAAHNHSNAAGGGNTLTSPTITGPFISGIGGTGAGFWKDTPTFTNGFSVPVSQTSNFNGSTISNAVLATSLVADYLKKSGTGSAWVTPTLGTGYTQGPASGTFDSVRYRVNCEDELIIVGIGHTSAASPATAFFTLNSGYRPATPKKIGVILQNGSTFINNDLLIDASGNVSFGATITGTNTDIPLEIRFPMGNI